MKPNGGFAPVGFPLHPPMVCLLFNPWALHQGPLSTRMSSYDYLNFFQLLLFFYSSSSPAVKTHMRKKNLNLNGTRFRGHSRGDPFFFLLLLLLFNIISPFLLLVIVDVVVVVVVVSNVVLIPGREDSSPFILRLQTRFNF